MSKIELEEGYVAVKNAIRNNLNLKDTSKFEFWLSNDYPRVLIINKENRKEVEVGLYAFSEVRKALEELS